MTLTALDWLMDRSVVPGYSAIGYRLRGLAESDPDPEAALRGRRVLVTGANSGIGEAACIDFAKAGAVVVMVVRDLERGEAARTRIAEAAGIPAGAIEVGLCDLSSLASVRAFAARLEGTAVDLLVHNAGALLAERTRNLEGFEMTFAIHVLGPFLLTRLLAPELARCEDGRVIFVVSGGMYSARIQVDDLELERRPYKGATVYAHAKRAQMILTGELDRRLPGPRPTVHAMHPGWVDTPGVEEALPSFRRITKRILRDAAQGADTIVWLAAANEPRERSGRLWMDRRVRPEHRLAKTKETAADRDELYRRVSKMVGLEPV